MLKFSKLAFNCTWTENIQMFKLDLEKAEEPEIKWPTSTESQKKQENSRKTSISASLTMLKHLTVWITTNCGTFLKRWEYQITLPDFWEICAGQEATVRTRHTTIDWFKTGKGVPQGCILSPCLFNFYAEYTMRNARLDESQAVIKTAGRNINNLRYTGDTTLMAKILLMKVKDESEKVGLKLNIQKMKIMASGPITSGKQMEKQRSSDRLYVWGFQNHCR